MNSAISAYETSLQSDLSGWTGLAQKEFINNSGKQIATAKAYVTSIDELANFITNAVSNIESAEAEISSINI